MIPASIPDSFAHQIDSVGNYRIEIGWINEPAFSKETNGIELYVNTMDPNIPPEEQTFDQENGIDGLEESLRLELVFKGEKIKLPLFNDHNVKGKYYTLVDPTVPGYYQLNVLGNIGDTVVSKSLHPPKVDNREFIEFPKKANEEILEEHEKFRAEIDKVEQTLNTKIIDEHTSMQKELGSIRSSIQELMTEESNSDLTYLGIGMASLAIVISIVSLRRK